MQGGFGQDSTNKAALTAFVAIAMMEAGFQEERVSVSGTASLTVRVAADCFMLAGCFCL